MNNFLSFNFEDYCKKIDESYINLIDKIDKKTYYNFYLQKYSNITYIDEQKFLYETLTLSANIGFAALRIQWELNNFYKKLQVKQISPIIVKPELSGEIYVSIPIVDNIKNIIEKLNPILNRLNYFIAKTKNDIHPFLKNQVKILIIEPRYNIDITMDVYKTGILYHIAPDYYKEKILKFGLIPKNKSKLAYHPERIYGLVNLHNLNMLVNDLKKSNKNKRFKNYCLFKIDLNKHPHQLNFYLDPACADNGVYTLENISPDCIKFIKNI